MYVSPHPYFCSTWAKNNDQIVQFFEHRRVVLRNPRSLISELALARDTLLGREIKYLSIDMGWNLHHTFYPRNELRAIFDEFRRQSRPLVLILTDRKSFTFRQNISEDSNLKLYWDSTATRAAPNIAIPHAPINVVQRELDRSGLQIISFVEQRIEQTGRHMLQLPANELADWRRSLTSASYVSIRIQGRYIVLQPPQATPGSNARPTHNMLTQLPALSSLVLASSSFRDGVAVERVDNLPGLTFPFLRTLRLEDWYIGFDELVQFIKRQPFLRELILCKISFCPGLGGQLQSVARQGDGLASLLIRLTQVTDSKGQMVDKITVSSDTMTSDWVAAIVKSRFSNPMPL